MDSLTGTAKDLSGSPLGIIALFIVMLYAFASLVTSFSGSFSPDERKPLIYFLVVFPFVVLGIFAWLVSQHSTKLYAPKDFRNEDNYVRTAAQNVVTAAAYLSAAQARSPTFGPDTALDIGAIVANVQRTTRQDVVRSQDKRLLWVDDNPDNNILERRAFESAGFSITLSLTTDQALDLAKTQRFSAIISDMGRKEGSREGYNLLSKLRSSGDTTPYFIYAGSNLSEHKREALENGAQGSTNNPNELFGLVTSAVR